MTGRPELPARPRCRERTSGYTSDVGGRNGCWVYEFIDTLLAPRIYDGLSGYFVALRNGSWVRLSVASQATMMTTAKTRTDPELWRIADYAAVEETITVGLHAQSCGFAG